MPQKGSSALHMGVRVRESVGTVLLQERKKWDCVALRRSVEIERIWTENE